MIYPIGTLFSYNIGAYSLFKVIDVVQKSWGIEYTLQYEYLTNPGVEYTTTWNEYNILHTFKLVDDLKDFELEFSI